MSHEFATGDKFCLGCGHAAKKIASAEPCPFDPPKPEPEKPAQVWHLNVWTNVNGVLFTAQHQYDGPHVVGWAATEAVKAVTNINLDSTPAEE